MFCHCSSIAVALSQLGRQGRTHKLRGGYGLLHVHERIDAMSILAAVRKRMNGEKAGKINEGTQPGLFNASFVDKRDVKDRKDEDLTQDPEMVKAFRDTWDAITVAKSHTRPGT